MVSKIGPRIGKLLFISPRCLEGKATGSQRYLELLPNYHPVKSNSSFFGKGVRDYRYQEGLSRRELEVGVVKSYNQSFHNLRRDVLASQEFRELQDDHYVSSGDSAASRLTNNLLGTEIDVVLETPNHLFIGEVKHESTLGADGKLVLVHQLIRQYVTATILLQLVGDHKEVIPFVVGDDTDYLKRNSQIRFMINQGWLRQTNILDWNDIKRAQMA